MPSCSHTSKTAIKLFGTISPSPPPPKDLREALIKFEQLANRPDVTSCPFLRIASEYPDTSHPFHRRVIEHQDKILDYLSDLLRPFAIDKRAAAESLLALIDGALSMRLVFGTSKEVPPCSSLSQFLSSAEAILKSFQSA